MWNRGLLIVDSTGNDLLTITSIDMGAKTIGNITTTSDVSID